eukprot:gene4304-3119_t
MTTKLNAFNQAGVQQGNQLSSHNTKELLELTPQPPAEENRGGRPHRVLHSQPQSQSQLQPPEEDGILAFFNSYAPPPDQVAAPSSSAAAARQGPKPLPAATLTNAARCALQRRKMARPTILRAFPGSIDEEEKKKSNRSHSPHATQRLFTVILDIDNTLVHATPDKRPCDYEITVTLQNKSFVYYVSERPYVKDLFEYLRNNPIFEVIIFTAAQEEYATEIVRHLDPTRSMGLTPGGRLLSSAHTTDLGNRRKIKDLARMGRPIETMVIVEDNPDSFLYQKRSSFPISHWTYQMENDEELQVLMRVLDQLKHCDTVVDVLDQYKSFNLILGSEEEKKSELEGYERRILISSLSEVVDVNPLRTLNVTLSSALSSTKIISNKNRNEIEINGLHIIETTQKLKQQLLIKRKKEKSMSLTLLEKFLSPPALLDTPIRILRYYTAHSLLKGHWILPDNLHSSPFYHYQFFYSLVRLAQRQMGQKNNNNARAMSLHWRLRSNGKMECVPVIMFSINLFFLYTIVESDSRRSRLSKMLRLAIILCGSSLRAGTVNKMSTSPQQQLLRKVLYTAYRKMLKLGKGVDDSVALRSRISCSPQLVYNHERGVWVPIDIPTMCRWPESKRFLDHTIRCLNGGRCFYLPLPPPDSLPSCGSSPRTSSDPRRDGASESLHTASLPIGADLSITQALRRLFETTPFSMVHLNNALAAVKELGYITSLPIRDPSVYIPSELKALQSKVHFIATAEAPPRNNVSVVLKGLTEDMRRHLQGAPEKEVVGGETDPTASKPAEEEAPREVQLLVAHPQLSGYFRNTIMLLVQNTPTSAAAFVLNKMLLSERKYAMPLSSVIRMAHAHGLYVHHLKHHPVLLGGPVLPSGPERAITLLHRIPNVSHALRVGSANLWLNGDPDELKARIDAGEARAEEIAVLCGFAGWGADQLQGEIATGTFIVASNTPADEAEADTVGAYLLELSRSSCKRVAKLEEPDATDAAAAHEAEERGDTVFPGLGEEPGEQEQMLVSGVAAWSSVFATLPGSVSELHRNWRCFKARFLSTIDSHDAVNGIIIVIIILMLSRHSIFFCACCLVAYIYLMILCD